MVYLNQFPNAVVAFFVGMALAVGMMAIEHLQPLSFFDEESWGYIGVHALMYGGVGGTLVYVTHTILSAFLYGIAGHLVVPAIVSLRRWAT